MMRTITLAEYQMYNVNEDLTWGFKVGLTAIECTIKDLIDQRIGTACGGIGNEAFRKFPAKFHDRKVVCFLDQAHNELNNPINIECKSEREAEKFEDLISDSDGSARYNGVSDVKGFYNFETE